MTTYGTLKWYCGRCGSIRSDWPGNEWCVGFYIPQEHNTVVIRSNKLVPCWAAIKPIESVKGRVAIGEDYESRT
jgi:hypothetical protein